jgi:hypothetical protein
MARVEDHEYSQKVSGVMCVTEQRGELVVQKVRAGIQGAVIWHAEVLVDSIDLVSTRRVVHPTPWPAK